MAVAVVTGGASGFGLALADRCAAAGYAVALLDRDAARVEAEAAALAAAHGVDVLGLAVDVTDGPAVDDAAAAVRERFSGVDLVISNVGVQLFGSIDRMTDAEWQWVLDVNVVGSARVARAFSPMLREAPKGYLAFTTSSSVLDPAARMAAYQSSKFAVWGLAETLRLELAADDIGVTVVFPSGMITRHLESSTDAQPASISRAIGADDDFSAMVESNPGMVEAVVPPEEAARRVLDAILAGEPYVITHGDLVTAVDKRTALLHQAAEAARES